MKKKTLNKMFDEIVDLNMARRGWSLNNSANDALHEFVKFVNDRFNGEHTVSLRMDSVLKELEKSLDKRG